MCHCHGPGMGAIAVIRLSGKGCIEICDRIFVSPSHKKLVDVLPNTIHFGKIVNKEELIDEVLISVFHAPTPSPEKTPSKFLAMVQYTFSNAYYNY